MTPIEISQKDPIVDELNWFCNQTYDNLLDPSEPPYSEEEDKILPGEGAHDVGCEFAEIAFGGGAMWNDKRCFVPTVEFHYRNDSTREMWGSPISLEEHLPSMDVQTNALKNMFAQAYPILSSQHVQGTVAIDWRAYMQADGRSTDDRHVLYFVMPIESVLKNLNDSKEYLIWMMNIMFGINQKYKIQGLKYL